jgi:hypothetical protein
MPPRDQRHDPARVEALEQVIKELMTGAVYYLDTDYKRSCGYHCQFCNGFLPALGETDDPFVHEADCPITRANDLLTGLGGDHA